MVFNNFIWENNNNVYESIRRVVPKEIKNDDVVFVCIGTDRSTGDSLGPLVGTFLKSLGYNNVYGTIDEPVHAKNIKEIVASIPKNKKIIAIDACLGAEPSIGNIDVFPGSFCPGVGTGNELISVGDYSILAVVNIKTQDDSLNFQILQCTQLSFVLSLAKKIVRGIVQAFPLWDVQNEMAVSVDYDLLLAR